MEFKSVTLMVRFKDLDGKWKRRPAARGANGRVKPGHALINGNALPVKDGAWMVFGCFCAGSVQALTTLLE